MYDPQRTRTSKHKEPPTSFTENELLHMEVKAIFLLGKENMHWWKRLSPQEKHRILYTEQYDRPLKTKENR